MVTIREQFCLKSAVEKDILKAQSISRKANDELKIMKAATEAINDQIFKLDENFLTEEKYKA